MHNGVFVLLYDYEIYPVKLSGFKLARDIKYFSDFITWFPFMSSKFINFPKSCII